MNDVVKQSIEAFDYNSLADDVRAETLDLFYRLRSLFRRSAEDVIEIGRLLARAKDLLGERFDEWARVELNISASSIRRFILASKKAELIPELRSVQPSVLYLLAEPSTPEEVVSSVIEKAKSGAAVKVKEIEEALQQAREANERAKRLEDELDAALSEATDLRHRLEESERAREEIARRAEYDAKRAEGYMMTLNRRSEELMEAEQAYEELKRELADLKARPPKVEVREVAPPPGELERRKKELEAQKKQLEGQIAAMRREIERGHSELAQLKRRAAEASGEARMAELAAQQAVRLAKDLATIQGLAEAHAATPEILASGPAQVRGEARELAGRARAAAEQLLSIAEALGAAA